MEERFRELFDYLHSHHDLILTQSEEQDLAHIVDNCLLNNCKCINVYQDENGRFFNRKQIRRF